MIGLDTNVVLRLALADDAGQAEAATRLVLDRLAAGGAYVSDIVLVEAAWVMLRGHGMERDVVAGVLGHLLDIEGLHFSNIDGLRQAVARYAAGRADFGDCLIAARNAAAGCAATYSFDRVAQRDLGFMAP